MGCTACGAWMIRTLQSEAEWSFQCEAGLDWQRPKPPGQLEMNNTKCSFATRGMQPQGFVWRGGWQVREQIAVDSRRHRNGLSLTLWGFDRALFLPVVEIEFCIKPVQASGVQADGVR